MGRVDARDTPSELMLFLEYASDNVTLDPTEVTAPASLCSRESVSVTRLCAGPATPVRMRMTPVEFSRRFPGAKTCVDSRACHSRHDDLAARIHRRDLSAAGSRPAAHAFLLSSFR
jgi:hypothetical protein